MDNTPEARENCIRVLHVLGTLDMGGAESRVMDLYRHMDKDRVQFDFLIHDQTPPGGSSRPKGYYEDEVTSMGGRIYILPRFRGSNYLEYRNAVRAFFAAHHEWAVVEGHMTSTASIYLPEAKKAGIRVTAAHARSAGTDSGLHGMAIRLLRSSLPGKCDYMMSCSSLASEAVFGKKAAESGAVMIVPNAVDTKNFSFDEEKRSVIRKEFGIPESAFVIGHVGRFDAMKNQGYLAEVGRILREIAPDRQIRFLFVGTNAKEAGDWMAKVQENFDAAGLSGAPVFAGRCDRERTVAMYQAFDAFAFPSLYEGLPGTVIEAQASGLPCYIADTVTEEVCVTSLARRLSLEDPAAWAEEIAQNLTNTESAYKDFGVRRERSLRALADLAQAGYDAAVSAKRMQQWYLEKAGR